MNCFKTAHKGIRSDIVGRFGGEEFVAFETVQKRYAVGLMRQSWRILTGTTVRVSGDILAITVNRS